MSDPGSDDQAPDDSILAAECALGLGDGAERLALDRRVRRDRAFALLVSNWEIRLAALFGDAVEVAPPPAVKARIDEELFGGAALAPPRRSRASAFGALSFWRLAALAFAALSIVCLGLLARPLLTTPQIAPQRLIAALAPTDAAALALVFVDATSGRLDVSGLSIDRGAGDAELWVIPAGGAPRSLGLLAAGAATTKTLSRDLLSLLQEGAALAVSLEPRGGSPTGAPTGPVVAIGPLRRLE